MQDKGKPSSTATSKHLFTEITKNRIWILWLSGFPTISWHKHKDESVYNAIVTTSKMTWLHIFQPGHQAECHLQDQMSKPSFLHTVTHARFLSSCVSCVMHLEVTSSLYTKRVKADRQLWLFKWNATVLSRKYLEIHGNICSQNILNYSRACLYKVHSPSGICIKRLRYYCLSVRKHLAASFSIVYGRVHKNTSTAWDFSIYLACNESEQRCQGFMIKDPYYVGGTGKSSKLFYPRNYSHFKYSN